MTDMTRTERQELAQLIRRREKLAKADVDRVAAERLAGFEQQAASIYRADDDDVWADAMRTVQQAVDDASVVVAERCRTLGVPDWTAPTINATWYGRGQNAVKARVTELRKVAKTRFDADAKAAKAAIERASVDVQTQLVAGGLESDEARAFLDAMPTAQGLMPVLAVADVEKLLAPPERRTGHQVVGEVVDW
jgi:hypothetical protein